MVGGSKIGHSGSFKVNTSPLLLFRCQRQMTKKKRLRAYGTFAVISTLVCCGAAARFSCICLFLTVTKRFLFCFACSPACTTFTFEGVLFIKLCCSCLRCTPSAWKALVRLCGGFHL